MSVVFVHWEKNHKIKQCADRTRLSLTQRSRNYSYRQLERRWNLSSMIVQQSPTWAALPVSDMGWTCHNETRVVLWQRTVIYVYKRTIAFAFAQKTSGVFVEWYKVLPLAPTKVLCLYLLRIRSSFGLPMNDQVLSFRCKKFYCI